MMLRCKLICVNVYFLFGVYFWVIYGVEFEGFVNSDGMIGGVIMLIIIL